MAERSVSDRPRTIEPVALLVFALVTGWVCLHHEPWHDELQAWRLALDTPSVVDLVTQMGYEGHPPLFHLLLRGLGAFTRSWAPVAAAHWLVAVASAWLVLYRAPFTRLQRILVIAGYFVAYEYTVIVRPYGLGMLCALAACAAWCGTVRRPRVTALMLVLLAATSLIGLILAVVIWCALVLDMATDARSPAQAAQFRRYLPLAVLGTAVLVVGIIVILVPPGDALYRGMISTIGTEWRWRIGSALSIPARALTPFAAHLPDGSTHWGQWPFAVDTRMGSVLGAIAGVTVIGLVSVVVARRRTALVVWLLAVGAFVIFFAFFFPGSVRHHGYLVVAMLVAAWLASSTSRGPGDASDVRMLRALEPRLARVRSTVFAVLLLPMVGASVQLARADWREQFSDAASVAALLRRPALDSLPIVGIAFAESQAVAALLGKPVYLPAERRISTWLARRHVLDADAAAVAADSVVRMLLGTRCSVVVLTNATMQRAHFAGATVQLLQSSSRKPMAGGSLVAWLVTAGRCAGAGGTAPP